MSLREKWNQYAHQKLEAISSEKAAYDLKRNFKLALIGIALFPEKPLPSNFAERRVYVNHKRLLNADPQYKALFTEYSTAIQTLDKSEYLPHNTDRYHNMSTSQILWDILKSGVCGFIHHPQETYRAIKTPDKLFGVYKERIETITP